ncbi:MAG: xylulokinase [Ancrocorticia sp.]|uniref:xylulokinase n=1 Tax=Ancrocorticia sp. TaxID=2593684 RepID=UPI003F8FAE21
MSTDAPLVIAIDTSTTATKAIIVDPEGNVLASARRELQLKTPQMSYFEQDPLEWWTSTNESVGEAVAALKPSDRDRIAAMGMTHQRETFAPFDIEGNPLRDGLTWMDGRAAKEVANIGNPAIHALSGKPPATALAIYKLAWLKKHEPDSLRLADKIVEVHGYLTFKLTGKWVTSVGAADSLGMLDIAAQDFDPGLMIIGGVKREQLSDLVKPGDVMGEIDSQITREWGLKQTIPLVAGVGDGQAAGVGTAAVAPDTMYLNLGTGVVGGVHGSEYGYGSVYRTLVAGIPDWYDFELNLDSGAWLAQWFREKLGDAELAGAPDPELEAAAAKIPAGSRGLVTLPYWNGVAAPHWDARARGAMIGWRGNHDGPTMYRSILESIAMEMRYSLEQLEVETGIKVTEARAMGGGTRSPLWRQIMTDALGMPLVTCEAEEVSAMGAAVMAMSVTGVHGPADVAHYAEKMVRLDDTSYPDQTNYETYGELSQIHREVYPALRKINKQIHKFVKHHPE